MLLPDIIRIPVKGSKGGPGLAGLPGLTGAKGAKGECLSPPSQISPTAGARGPPGLVATSLPLLNII